MTCAGKLVIAVLALGLATAGVRAQDTICFEAEAAEHVDPPMRRVQADDPALSAETRRAAEEAGGKACLEIPQGAGNPPEVMAGAARYVLEVPQAGDYVLWCRVWWEDECGNSFTMKINDQPPFIFGQDSTVKCWHWVKAPPRLRALSLPAGQHTLVVSNREDGVKLDQILLTTQTRYVPVGLERPRGRGGVQTEGAKGAP